MHRTTTLTALAAGALVAGSAAVLVPAAAADTPPARGLAWVVTSDRAGDTEIVVRTPHRRYAVTRNGSSDYGAVWSPDGTRLAFVSDRDGDDEVFVVGADGSGLRQLTRNDGALDQAPAWSPDGTRLAFVSGRDGGEPEVYVMAADGSGQQRVTTTEPHVVDHAPTWTPDGSALVFTSSRDGFEDFELYRVRVDGTGLQQLTTTDEGVNDTAPDVSADGRWIAFASDRGGDQDVWRMPAGGGEAVLLHGTRGTDEVHPRWTADGRHVLFSTFGTEAGPGDVRVVGADGTGLRVLSRGRYEESFGDPRP